VAEVEEEELGDGVVVGESTVWCGVLFIDSLAAVANVFSMNRLLC
jgi:hypothetical protein